MNIKEIRDKIKEFEMNQKIPAYLNKYRKKAELLLKDQKKMDHFLQRLERKLAKIPYAGKYLSDIPVFISLVRSYMNKEYTDLPIGSLLSIVSALIYFFSPIDILPDFMVGLGFTDDAAVLLFVYKLVHDDVQEYKDWVEKRNKE